MHNIKMKEIISEVHVELWSNVNNKLYFLWLVLLLIQPNNYGQVGQYVQDAQSLPRKSLG